MVTTIIPPIGRFLVDKEDKLLTGNYSMDFEYRYRLSKRLKVRTILITDTGEQPFNAVRPAENHLEGTRQKRCTTVTSNTGLSKLN